MEQNEEIIVRVYQEKERHWDERLRDMKTQLDRAVTNETGLKTQVQRLQEQRDQLQFTIQNLTAEKIGLQRKVYTGFAYSSKKWGSCFRVPRSRDHESG